MLSVIGLFALLLAVEPSSPPSLQGYAPACLSEFVHRTQQEHPDSLKPLEGKDHMDVHPVQKISVRVRFLGKSRVLDGLRREFVEAWCAQNFTAAARGGGFQREVLVSDGVSRQWVALQEQLWGFWKDEVALGQVVDVQLAFIGSATQEWVFLANGFGASPQGPDPAFVGMTEVVQARCDAGSALSCTELARRYVLGDGVKADDPAGLRLDLRACELGLGEACRDAGAAFEQGLGGKRDMMEAARLFGAACKLDDAAGCAWLGDLFESGQGVERDLVKAAGLRGYACELGYAKACPPRREGP
jgi:TPR repeat protein